MASVYRQAQRDFRKKLKELGTTVNVHYANQISDDGWGNIQLDGTFQNVPIAIDEVSNLNIKRYEFADVKTGKRLFFMPWSYKVDGVEVNIDLTKKAYVEIEFNADTKYVLNGVVACDPIGNEFLCQLGVQK